MKNESKSIVPCNTEDPEKNCAWWINSPTHGNCLWLYIKDFSQIDGSMKEHVQSEIAQLMNWSNTKTHFMLKQATEELIAALKAANAQQLINNEEDSILSILSGYSTFPGDE